MGEGKLNQAVVDSGPVIHLSEIEALPLLRIFSALHLPDAVWSETVERGRVASSALLGLPSMQRHTLSQRMSLDLCERTIWKNCRQGNVSVCVFAKISRS